MLQQEAEKDVELQKWESTYGPLEQALKEEQLGKEREAEWAAEAILHSAQAPHQVVPHGDESPRKRRTIQLRTQELHTEHEKLKAAFQHLLLENEELHKFKHDTMTHGFPDHTCGDDWQQHFEESIGGGPTHPVWFIAWKLSMKIINPSCDVEPGVLWQALVWCEDEQFIHQAYAYPSIMSLYKKGQDGEPGALLWQ